MKISFSMVLLWSMSLIYLGSCKHDPVVVIAPNPMVADSGMVPCLPPCDLIPCFDVNKPWFTSNDTCLRVQYDSVSSNIVNFIKDSVQTFPGSINPNNQEEMVFSISGSVSEKVGLWIINMCTGIKRKVVSEPTIFPQWTANDWIVFAKLYDGIWKIKVNGDSLSPIPSISSERWKDLGCWVRPNHPNQLVYFSQEKGAILATLEGTVLSKFPSIKEASWSFDGSRLITYKDSSIGFFDLSTGAFTPAINQVPRTHSYSAGSNSDEILWRPSEKSIYEPGLHLTNAGTGATVFLKKYLTNLEYQGFFPSPDGAMIITSIRETKHISGSWFSEDNYIGFLSFDGSCEIIGEFDR